MTPAQLIVLLLLGALFVWGILELALGGGRSKRPDAPSRGDWED